MVATTHKFRLAATNAGRVVEAFLSRGRRSAATYRSYRSDMTALAEFLLGPPDETDQTTSQKRIEKAVGRILRMKPGTAHELALQYEVALKADHKAPATIKHRLTALSSLIKSAARIGVIEWTIDIDYPPVITYADTQGPSRAGFMQMLDAAAGQEWAVIAARDVAAMWLMFGLGLRSGEVRSLTLADVDLTQQRLTIAAKGASGAKQWLTMPPETLDAVATWISHRGYDKGPLITPLHPAAKGDNPMSETGLANMIAKHGKTAGIRHVSPHGIRHAACTEAAIQCGGDVLRMKDFTRHADINTVLLYLDRQVNRGADVATAVASGTPVRLPSGKGCDN